MNLNTTLLIDISDDVKQFLNNVDSVISDLNWDVRWWILGFNEFYKEAYSYDEIIHEYPDPTYGKLPESRQRELDQDRGYICRYVMEYLYPAIHEKMIYKHQDKHRIENVDLKTHPSIRCYILVRE